MREIICVTEAGYAGALTRGAKYHAQEIDDGARQFRIINDQGKLRWYPAWCFDAPGVVVKRLASFRIDDPIEDPDRDWVEVTLTLTTGEKRWCAFTTPAHLEHHGEEVNTDGHPFRASFGMGHVIITARLSETVVHSSLVHMDKRGILELCSLPLSDDAAQDQV